MQTTRLMKPTQTLPPGYQPLKTLDLGNNQKALILLNLVGLVLFVVFGGLFLQLIRWFHPDFTMENLTFTIQSPGQGVTMMLGMVTLMVVMIVLHEGIHGVCFWRFTRARPKFAFKGAYAYAAAPGWYIPRTPYLITTLAPFVVLSLACVGLLRFVSPEWFFPVTLFATLNASGAVGDLIVAFWLLQQPPSCLALDRGDSVTLYVENCRPTVET